jgi:hypothetical protein
MILWNYMPCRTDADCYTTCIKPPTSAYGICSRPFDDPAPAFEKCLNERLDSTLKSTLLRMWGVFNGSDTAAFGVKMREKASRGACRGSNGYLFNGGWFKRTDGYTGPLPTPVDSDEDGNDIFAVADYLAIDTGMPPAEGVEFKYTQCYYESTDCFYLPPNQEACEYEKRCNWDNQSENCLSDPLNNGGSTCAANLGDIPVEMCVLQCLN